MVAPSVVQAAAAVSSNGYGGGGGGGSYDGRGGESYPDEGYEAGADAGGGDEGYADYAADQDQEEIEGLGDIDYERALTGAGLGDWQSELKNFGVTAGKTVASQALTAVATKLGGGAKPYTPPPDPPMSMATKVAIGAAIALPVGYLLLRRPSAA